MAGKVNPRLSFGVLGLVFTVFRAVDQAYSGIQVLKNMGSTLADKVTRTFAETPKPSVPDSVEAPASEPCNATAILGEDPIERVGEMAQTFFASAYNQTAEFADSVDEKIRQNLPLGVSTIWWTIPDSFKIGGAVALTFWLLGIWPFGQRVNVTQNVTIHVTKDQKVTTKKTGNDVDVEVTSNRRIDWENNNSSIHTLAAAYMAGHQAGLKKCLVPPYEMLGRNVPRRIKG